MSESTNPPPQGKWIMDEGELRTVVPISEGKDCHAGSVKCIFDTEDHSEPTTSGCQKHRCFVAFVGNVIWVNSKEQYALARLTR